MRTVLLLGGSGTKRTVYFEQAARSLGLPFTFLEWDDWARQGLPPAEEYFIKIDPPSWDSCYLDQMEPLIQQYKEQLTAIGQHPAASFLNHPSVIQALLDKSACKKRLEMAGIPVTQSHISSSYNAAQLMEAMSSQRIFQVFIKPVYGSGAAGTAAFRFHPRTNRMALYTCAFIDPGSSRLLNTKRLRCFTAQDEIIPLLDSLLSLGCLVERWYSKAEYSGYSYDLRAVIQEGRMDFLLARLSKGPITNLHLNNRPLDASELNLPKSLLADMESLCRNAAACYPGLGCAGIDILLEKGSLRPRIIEMNGQGDLLYQDIYKDNRIYLHQAQMMKRWLLTGGHHG